MIVGGNAGGSSKTADLPDEAPRRQVGRPEVVGAWRRLLYYRVTGIA